jgi:deoxycytidylate deaminase
VFYVQKFNKSKGRKIIRKTVNITVYVVRIKGSDGSKKCEHYNMAESAPCIDCYNKMKNIGVKNIVYSDGKNKIIKTKLRDYKPISESCGRRFINRLS